MVFSHFATLLLLFTLFTVLRTAPACAESVTHQFSPTATVESTEENSREQLPPAPEADQPSMSALDDEVDETSFTDADVEDLATLLSEFHFQIVPHRRDISQNKLVTSFAGDALVYPP